MINPTYKKAFFTSAPSAEAYLGDLKSDGTVPLTADWNVGAFSLTAKNFTASPTLGAELITFNTAGLTAGGAWVGDPPALNGWTWDATHFDHASGGGTTALTAAWTPTIGVKYRTTFTIANRTDGGVYISAGGNIDMGGRYIGNLTYSRDWTAKTADALVFTPQNLWDGTITAVSTKVMSGAAVTTSEIYTTGPIYAASGTQFRPAYTFVDFPTSGLFCYNGYLEGVVADVAVFTLMSDKTYLYQSPLIFGQSLDITIARTTDGGLNISSDGLTQTMITNDDSDTDEVDSLTWAGGYGMVIAASVTDGKSAIWRLAGTTLSAVSVDVAFTATKDAAATYNIYFEGGAIKFQNKVGDNKAIKLGFFGI
jgi:hypothetical protein